MQRHPYTPHRIAESMARVMAKGGPKGAIEASAWPGAGQLEQARPGFDPKRAARSAAAIAAIKARMVLENN